MNCVEVEQESISELIIYPFPEKNRRYSSSIYLDHLRFSSGSIIRELSTNQSVTGKKDIEESAFAMRPFAVGLKRIQYERSKWLRLKRMLIDRNVPCNEQISVDKSCAN